MKDFLTWISATPVTGEVERVIPGGTTRGCIRATKTLRDVILFHVSALGGLKVMHNNKFTRHCHCVQMTNVVAFFRATYTTKYLFGM